MSNEESTTGNLDYRERSSVIEVHSSVRREKREPVMEAALIPWWYFIAGALVLMGGSLYLGAYNGGFRMDTVYAVADYAPAPRPQVEGAVVVEDVRPWIDRWMGEGQKVYALCAACHQPNGQGLPGMFPPLAGSEWVLGGTERLVAIIQAGIQGPLTVKGTVYGAVPMPAQGAILTDKQMAQVLTYVRRSWGNDASVVTEEMVAAGREKYRSRLQPWTEAELKALPEGNLPGEIPDLQTGNQSPGQTGS